MLQIIKSAKERSNLQDADTATKIIPIHHRHNSLLLCQQIEENDLEEIIIKLLKSNQEDKIPKKVIGSADKSC